MAADLLQIEPDLPEAGLPLAPRKRRGPGRPFAKGQSGNPAGRTKGSRNHATEAALLLLEGEGERLTRKAVELALEGDPTALKLCLDRILAPRRERSVRIPLPPLKSAADLTSVTAAILGAAAEGRLSPGEAFELSRVMDTAMRAISTSDFERRIKALEEDGVACAG